MEIIGVGTDIIEIPRIKSAMEKEGFAEKVFTEAERGYIFGKTDFAQTAAAMFCAKEAAAKALGTGFRGLSPRDIEVLHDASGAPYVRISKLSGIKVMVSLSHCREYACANAAAVKLSSIGDG